MLQNEPQTDPISPIGQIRVKPEELTHAVEAIERRKQEEAKRISSTIPIEQAVSDLHLDATPEEIWAEVQAHRAREAAAAAAAQQAAQVKPETQQQVQPPRRFRGRPRMFNAWRAVAFGGTIFWIIHAMGGTPHHAKITISSTSAPTSTSSLASMVDGQQAFCNTSTLVQISEGKPLSSIRVSTGDAPDNSWELVKMRGHIYLHAYTIKTETLPAIKGQTITVFNEDNSGALEGNRTSKITMRVDNVPLQVSGGDADYSEITVPKFQPDDLTTLSDWH